ncbi:unnamed protein product [Dovyalis caffra]|uniref:Uncharacterized protein n=1 Tax=Dovyalis caffra TaxID=77055 RepID=A0AAV1R5I9_9ROSI|nr:unnamed protein product [Dovyalis caffra]
MGSCASVHKGTAPESAMKLGVSFKPEKDKLVIPESPIKDNKQPTGHSPIKTFGDFALCDVPDPAHWRPDNVLVKLSVTCSKEETFFDSRAWLDSDCEDDFHSVNGDFTPSRGNTPVHHSSSAETPQVNTIPSDGRPPGSVQEPSPTGKKKRLSELFKDSISEDRDVDDLQTSGSFKQNIANGKIVKPTILDVLPKSANATPFLSGTNSVSSSERTPNGVALIEKERSSKSLQCCLPSLISCRSFSDRKKKSQAIAV